MQETGGVHSNKTHWRSSWAQGANGPGSWSRPWVEPVLRVYISKKTGSTSFQPYVSLTKMQSRERERESLQVTLSSPTKLSSSDVVAGGSAAASEFQTTPIRN
jgi:hypothetical protein